MKLIIYDIGMYDMEPDEVIGTQLVSSLVSCTEYHLRTEELWRARNDKEIWEIAADLVRLSDRYMLPALKGTYIQRR
jgi:hypothetical protein